MAENRSMYKCVILLSLIACHAILSAEGRQLKYKEKESSPKEETQRETTKQGRNSINLYQNAEDFPPTQPSAGIRCAENTVAGKNETLPPISFGDSAATFKDGFRPTTPGNSPDVGHKHAEHEENVESKVLDEYSLDAGRSDTGYKGDFRPTAPDDFRPTAPGHSPGAGHVLSNKSAEPKAGRSDTEYKDDFRPTTPGHSPGAGHVLSNKSAEPKA